MYYGTMRNYTHWEGDDTAAWTLPYFPHTDTIAGNASDCVQVRSAWRWGGVEHRTARTAGGGGAGTDACSAVGKVGVAGWKRTPTHSQTARRKRHPVVHTPTKLAALH